MVQAPQFDGLSLDPLSLQQNGLAAPEVDVGGREIVEALVIAPLIVVLDEGCDLGRLARSSFRAGCGSSSSGASVRSCPGSGGGWAIRGYASSFSPRANRPGRRRCNTGRCRKAAAAAA